MEGQYLQTYQGTYPLYQTGQVIYMYIVFSFFVSSFITTSFYPQFFHVYNNHQCLSRSISSISYRSVSLSLSSCLCFSYVPVLRQSYVRLSVLSLFEYTKEWQYPCTPFRDSLAINMSLYCPCLNILMSDSISVPFQGQPSYLHVPVSPVSLYCPCLNILKSDIISVPPPGTD